MNFQTFLMAKVITAKIFKKIVTKKGVPLEPFFSFKICFEALNICDVKIFFEIWLYLTVTPSIGIENTNKQNNYCLSNVLLAFGNRNFFIRGFQSVVFNSGQKIKLRLFCFSNSKSNCTYNTVVNR